MREKESIKLMETQRLLAKSQVKKMIKMTISLVRPSIHLLITVVIAVKMKL